MQRRRRAASRLCDMSPCRLSFTKDVAVKLREEVLACFSYRASPDPKRHSQRAKERRMAGAHYIVDNIYILNCNFLILR